MSLITLTATIECDRCGVQFIITLDPSDKPPADWSLWEVVEDEVRGGTSGDDPLRSTSVQDGMMLCGTCTALIDQESEV